jgi:hypothetical protein
MTEGGRTGLLVATTHAVFIRVTGAAVVACASHTKTA